MTDATDMSGKTAVRAAHSVIWNYSGYACQILVNLGVMAYVARFLSVPEYGMYLFVLSISANLNLLDMGIGNVLILWYMPALDQQDSDRLNDLLAATFVALSLLGILGMSILASFVTFLPGPFTIPASMLREASALFLLAAIAIPFSMSGVALDQLYQAAQRFDRINQIRVLTAMLQLGLSIAVLREGFGILGLAAIQLGMAILRVMILAAALPSNVPGARLQLTRFRMAAVKPLLQLSKWAFLTNLAVYLTDLMIWAVLGAFGSMSEVAMFAVAMKMPKQLWNLMDRAATAVNPEFSRLAARVDDGSLRRIFLRTHQLLVTSMLPFIVMGIALAGPILHVWVGPKYANAGSVMRWLLIGSFSHAFSYAADLLLYARAKIKLVAWITLCGGASSVISGLLMVPRYGAAGLAAGVALSQLLITALGLSLFACRIAGVAPLALVTIPIKGQFWPLLVLLADCALLWAVRSHLSPVWLVVLGSIGGCTYLSIWGIRTVLPMYKNELTSAT
ncbi:MAG TPA: oligosaccharide flippase family protein [Terriglobales bacterium]|nr:oligosaccharide flippase family protein [Terriglobales bacterium]